MKDCSIPVPPPPEATSVASKETCEESVRVCISQLHGSGMHAISSSGLTCGTQGVDGVEVFELDEAAPGLGAGGEREWEWEWEWQMLRPP